MWRDKQPDGPLPAGPESRNVQTNQPAKSAPAFLEGLTRTGSDAMRSAGVASWLGPGWQVKGEISGNEDLLIDGSVEGVIQIDEGKLTIGTAAKVTANIVARAVAVYGQLKGNVRAKDRIEIKKDASVTGDLTTPQIMIEDGAYFKGSIEIAKSSEREADKNLSSSTTGAAKAGAGPNTA